MPRIKILPPDVRNKIAAGEVIERPASVVKELIENALDAESTNIRIDVLAGGKRLIRVADDGIGMDRYDALVCFERHATSKLANDDDLFSIRTMGFRGEALPSIASVSKVRLLTAPRGNSVGVAIEIIGGSMNDVKDAPAIGTTVEVKDLFFNTPARKKFLKSSGTELHHILDIVTREALCHWETGFTVNADNRETLSLPPASGPRERIVQVFGDEFVKGLLETHAEETGIHCLGFTSNRAHFRSTKSHQFIFLNRRPIKDPALSHAVYRAYEGVLPRDKHPIFFLFLEIDPSQVDVNVHPTKREVRFQNREFVYQCVYAAIAASLRKEHAESTEKRFGSATVIRDHPPSASVFLDSSDASLRAMTAAENLDLAYVSYPEYLYVGDTFIAVSTKEGLMLIDYHAAHERILYEKLLGGSHPNSHRLLFPTHVSLSPKEYAVVLEHADRIKELGIDIEDFGHNTIIVRSLPDFLRYADIQGILSDIAFRLADGLSPDTPHKEELAATIACHRSIRGKEVPDREKLSALLNDLEKTEHPDQCPHGRPTRIFLTREDLKKMFKRK